MWQLCEYSFPMIQFPADLVIFPTRKCKNPYFETFCPFFWILPVNFTKKCKIFQSSIKFAEHEGYFDMWFVTTAHYCTLFYRGPLYTLSFRNESQSPIERFLCLISQSSPYFLPSSPLLPFCKHFQKAYGRWYFKTAEN